MVPMHGRMAERAFHEPATQIRMTNDQIRKNDKMQMTKPAPAPRRTFRHSDFGFLSSFVIRHLSFGRSGSGSQCMASKPSGFSMNRPIVARASRPCEQADRH